MIVRKNLPGAAQPGCDHHCRRILEVIVTSAEDAIRAERGGADRLEVVRCLEQGGLTPSVVLVEEVLAAVSVPVRVMLRETPSMTIDGPAELHSLVQSARSLGRLPVQGLVLGFVKDGAVDTNALQRILPEASGVSITFHRAFEHLKAPQAALEQLKGFPQIDRVLVRISPDGPYGSLAQVKDLQLLAEPQIRFIVGIGLDLTLLPVLARDKALWEVHAGRAAREQEGPHSVVSQFKVASLKDALA